MTVRDVLLAAGVMILLAPVPAVGQEPAVPDTMLAAAIDHGGGPEVLQTRRLPIPKPKAGEVLVAMHAAGVAVWEAAARQNPPKDARFPVVLGTEGSGVVAALGPDVNAFSVGDAVYGEIHASYAQFATARADRIIRIPSRLNFAEAAALGVSGLSALQGVEDVLRIKRGETLIIHGAAGAVGTFAIQLAKRRGAKVLATATDDAGLALVTRLGADEAVNGRTGDIAAAARLLSPRGVDAVLGLAGGEALERCIDTLRKDGEGRIAYLYGVEPQPRSRYGITTIVYSYTANPQKLSSLNDAVRRSGLEVVVAAEYPLDQAAAAHERLERGRLLGKMVFRID
ncbi:MAG TPA: NADP-dependent oxidoreductase [Gammaproteobacteria bacterium]|nr:NADP-dependent oxidoreductase [Gammaproteobacteria bacterium]